LGRAFAWRNLRGSQAVNWVNCGAEPGNSKKFKGVRAIDFLTDLIASGMSYCRTDALAPCYAYVERLFTYLFEGGPARPTSPMIT
jgi:hypothetical protein